MADLALGRRADRVALVPSALDHGLQLVTHSRSPRIYSSHSPTFVDAKVDDAVVIAVVAALRAVVHPYRRHSERLGGREVLDHVVGEQRMSGVDAEPFAQQLIAVRVGLRAIAAGVDVVQVLEMIVDANRLEDAPGIGRIAVGEDEAPPGQTGQSRASRSSHCTRSSGISCTSSRKSCGSTPCSFIRPARVVPCSWKCFFWTRSRFSWIAAEQALDIGAHALVDQREQAGRRGIEAIVEVEDPVADVGEARVHERLERLAAFNPLQQIERYW